MLTWSPSVLRPGPLGIQPTFKPAGAPLHSALNGLVPLPEGTDGAKAVCLWLIRQPVMSTLVVPTLVSSNQSAATGLLPLLHGGTSVTATCAAEVPPLLAA